MDIFIPIVRELQEPASIAFVFFFTTVNILFHVTFGHR
jgi:hypothetical protein